MNTPLSIHILFHKDYTEGKQVYSSLYKTLCRDHKNPFMDGLDIPVYFSTGDDICGINKVSNDNSLSRFYLILIDQNMFCSVKWREHVAELIEQESKGSIKINCVALFKHAFAFNSTLGDHQFIRLKSESIIANIEEFEIRLFDNIIRYLQGMGTDKINVFISHSKKDIANQGEEMAMSLRDFLRSDTKLDSFFDANDILDGYRFDKQIKDGVKKSVLLILFTDTYSSREWCRIEALTAKKHKIPTIAVFATKGEINRVFPYIGNIPCTSYNGDWRPVINLLLRTALDQYYENHLLASMVQDKQEFIPYPPEAYSFSVIEKPDTNAVLYPEPPLGNEEMEVLNAINSGIKFVTPMQHLTSNIDLHETKVAISISESEDILDYGMGEDMLRDLTVELSRHILISNGRMVYGGDLRKDSYTELFRDLSTQYGQFEKTDNTCKYFDNYLAWPIFNAVNLDERAEYMNARIQLINARLPKEVNAELKDQFVPPTTVENSYLWARSLTEMRNQMEEVVNARVLVGGKRYGFKGAMPGLLEEMVIAKNCGHAIFLVGGFGGVTKSIIDVIEGKDTYQHLKDVADKTVGYIGLCDYYKAHELPIDYSVIEQIKISDLNNGLSQEQNNRLFHSSNIMEIVQLILEGLNNIINPKED